MHAVLRDDNWTDQLWNTWREKLFQCSLSQLQEIATDVGITFTGGNKAVKNKDTLVIALDEVSPQELEAAYQRVVLQ